MTRKTSVWLTQTAIPLTQTAIPRTFPTALAVVSVVCAP